MSALTQLLLEFPGCGEETAGVGVIADALPSPSATAVPQASRRSQTLTDAELLRTWESPAYQKSMMSYATTIATRHGLPVDETRAELLLGAWRELRTWDPSKGKSAESWSWRGIEWAALDMKRHWARQCERNARERDAWEALEEVRLLLDGDEDDAAQGELDLGE